MGGLASAEQFSRYYQLPSVGHCGGGAPDTYTGLQSVARWTETGKAPQALKAVEYQTASTTPGGPRYLANGPHPPSAPRVIG